VETSGARGFSGNSTGADKKKKGLEVIFTCCQRKKKNVARTGTEERTAGRSGATFLQRGVVRLLQSGEFSKSFLAAREKNRGEHEPKKERCVVKRRERRSTFLHT